MPNFSVIFVMCLLKIRVLLFVMVLDNVGVDDRIACPDCVGYLNEGECDA